MKPLRTQGTRTWKRPVIQLQTNTSNTTTTKLTNKGGCSTCNKRKNNK